MTRSVMSVTPIRCTGENDVEEMFAFGFMRRALVAGVLVAGLSSYFGVFVVQRRLSFLGSGLAHAAFGGVALGLLLHLEPLWIAVPFTALVALAINWVKDQTQLSGDTAIGIFFAVAMALGVIFLSLREDYATDAFAYLFGSILYVSVADIWMAAGLVAATAGLYRWWPRWAYATFDTELARADRLSVQRDDYLLSVLLAVAIVVSAKIVGILLVAAFLVLPAASARLVTTRFAMTTAIAVIVGVATAAVGLVVSFYVDLPTGATIIMVQAAAFVGATFMSRTSRLT